LRDSLVIAEIAFCLVLVTGAGLACRGFYQLLRVDPGFRTDHMLTFRMTLPALTYPPGTAVSRFYDQVLDRVRHIPGVQDAGAISHLPMAADYSSGSVFVETSDARALLHIPRTPYGYLETDQR